MMKLLLIPILCLLTLTARAQAPAADSSGPKGEGRAALATNYSERGISQTTHDPALQGDFWAGWGPQFRLGLLGTNVHFPNSESHLRLTAAAEINIAFSADAGLTIAYFDNHYFKEDNRNAADFLLGLRLFDYNIAYMTIGNFEGSQTKATSYSVQKEWPVFGNWKWDNTLGYVFVTQSGWKDFFWYETFIGMKPGNILYQAGLTYNSAPGQQFAGQSGIALILRATMRF